MRQLHTSSQFAMSLLGTAFNAEPERRNKLVLLTPHLNLFVHKGTFAELFIRPSSACTSSHTDSVHLPAKVALNRCH